MMRNEGLIKRALTVVRVGKVSDDDRGSHEKMSGVPSSIARVFEAYIWPS